MLLALTVISVAGLSCARPEVSSARVPRGRAIAPPTAGEQRAPDGSVAVKRPYSAKVAGTSFGRRGTVALWLRPARTLREESLELPLLAGEALSTRIWCRGNAVHILSHVGPAMTGDNEAGKPSPYRYQSLLTHLKRGRWYHAAWSWDASDASRNGFFLDGICQGGAGTYAYPGQLVPAKGDLNVRVGAEGLTVSALQLFDEPLDQPQLQAICRAAGHEAYTSEGVRFRGEKLVPTDVDWAHPIYDTSFDGPSVLKDWHLEGGLRMSVAGGNLLLENGPDAEQPQTRGRHLVCWLRREVPADFLLEFTVCPQERRRGPAIVFFNARGLNGENIFKPPIRARDGTFRQYHSGDIDSYHVSYWSGGRATANLRKNKGFHLAAVGKDLVYTAPAGAFQTVRLYKHGGKIRLMVDDILSLSHDDDGKTYGPVHTHSGWIGLRQMRHTQLCRYGHVRIYPLKH